jgi:hypothetical protein
MAALVYKRIQSHQWTEAWEQLTATEQEAFLMKLDEILKRSGGKRYVLLAWDTFGIEIFPDMQSLQQQEDLLNQLEFTKYVQMDTIQGEELASLGLALCVSG